MEEPLREADVKKHSFMLKLEMDMYRLGRPEVTEEQLKAGLEEIRKNPCQSFFEAMEKVK